MRESKEKTWEKFNKLDIDQSKIVIYFSKRKLEFLKEQLQDHEIDRMILNSIEENKRRHYKQFRSVLKISEIKYLLEFFRNCRTDSEGGQMTLDLLNYFESGLNKFEKIIQRSSTNGGSKREDQ